MDFFITNFKSQCLHNRVVLICTDDWKICKLASKYDLKKHKLCIIKVNAVIDLDIYYKATVLANIENKILWDISLAPCFYFKQLLYSCTSTSAYVVRFFSWLLASSIPEGHIQPYGLSASYRKCGEPSMPPVCWQLSPIFLSRSFTACVGTPKTPLVYRATSLS